MMKTMILITLNFKKKLLVLCYKELISILYILVSLTYVLLQILS